MYPALLTIHSIIRWVMLLVLLAGILRAWMGLRGNRPWSALENRLELAATIIMDLQLLIGLLLYFIFSPITNQIWTNLMEAFSLPAFQFFGVFHPLFMIAAAVALHVMRRKNKTSATDRQKHRLDAAFYVLSLLLIMLAIPWFEI
jgi:hypothetical protein